MLRAPACVVLVALALLSVSDARAATVAILRPESDSREIREALFRLKGELLAVGLEVLVQPRPPRPGDTASPDSRAWLERLASERGLEALLDVLGDGKPTGIDVWLRDRATARLYMTRVEPSLDTEDPGESLAIHAIEVLRSSFLAIDSAPPPLPARAEPADRVPAQPVAQVRRLGLELGATVVTGLGNVGPAVLPLLRLDFGIDQRLALQATLAGFGTRGAVESDAGDVVVDQQFGLFGVCLCPRASVAFEPMAGLGAGFLRTAIEGRANAPDVAHRGRGWSFLIEASGGARLLLSSRYFLTLGGHVQLAQPYVAIHVLDSVVATSGRPNFLGTLTLGAWR